VPEGNPTLETDEGPTRLSPGMCAGFKAGAGNGSAVLMTHGGVIQAAFQFFFGYGDAAFRRAYPAVGHTSITHWRKDGGTERWVLEFSNDRRHLQVPGSAV
jgi:broad specificity phosphatase PhoE